MLFLVLVPVQNPTVAALEYVVLDYYNLQNIYIGGTKLGTIQKRWLYKSFRNNFASLMHLANNSFL